MMNRRWVGTGMVEAFDARQTKLLELVLEKTRNYYRDLYETRPCYRYPLNINRLMRLCKRSGIRVLMAVRILSNSVDVDSEEEPPLIYERTQCDKKHMHRPYRIFIRPSARRSSENT